MLFNNWLRSPVAVGNLRCSARTNLVRVIQFESKVSFDVILMSEERHKTNWFRVSVETKVVLRDISHYISSVLHQWLHSAEEAA